MPGDRLAATTARLLFEAGGRLAGPRLPILILHRVLARQDPLVPDEMTADRFDRLCGMLAASWRVTNLSRAAAAMARGELPQRSLVVTFDDGYADNAEIALPILRRHGLVATFFIASGFLDGGRMWNDAVIESVRGSILERIDLDELGFGAHPIAGEAERRTLVGLLLSRLKYLPPAARDDAVDAVHRAAGRPKRSAPPMMRSAQVLELHRAGMEIGAHTVSHPILTALTPGEAEHEIAAGRAALEAIVSAPVDTLAYPNGKAGRDFDSSHVEIVRRLGFRAAVTTDPGAAGVGADPLRLPRFTPWDRSAWRWSARLLANAYARHPTGIATTAEAGFPVQENA